MPAEVDKKEFNPVTFNKEIGFLSLLSLVIEDYECITMECTKRTDINPILTRLHKAKVIDVSNVGKYMLEWEDASPSERESIIRRLQHAVYVRVAVLCKVNIEDIENSFF